MMRRWLLTLFAAAACPTLAAAQSPGEVVEYYHLDALGSVRVVTNQTGTVIRRHDFKPFGEEINGTFPNPDRKLFTGQERDSETALDYFGARYFRTGIGRFTTVDPGHGNGNIDDLQSWDAYAYARNNPLRFTDPDGREYKICAYGESCGRVSDQYFLQLEKNPGAGITLRNGWIFATVNGQQVVVGTYEQTSVDPTFNSFIRQTGDLASHWLRENVTEMGIGTAIAATGGLAAGAFSGGLAAEEVLGIGRVAAGAARASPGQVAQMQSVLAQQGRTGVERALRTLERRLAEHLSKIDAARAAGGYTSSMEREVANFRQLIAAARRILGK
jgi:RHS repeat-associated protein